ncbi:Pimeloyl-ACP methyl ester carboxylesterase [Cyclobacterium lianum]|uniref:Pimeloyl-ACP methyl ester carboxylesterase n=1 Tax=Cyclobacterium lianum TaxID=388280 RepID=A0A1M7I7P9_9BACT|nr:alpha/beta hydrolase [Cyclobacterium lianum]SHM36812.1 Pimeloyl-ACP methyl ester carboxylesterase [Cyclobacterium lianum]
MPDIAFWKTGKGQPLVLLPGFGETKEMWQEFVPEISHDCEIWCPDLPGFGESPALKKGYALNEVALVLANWLRLQGIENASLIGHSLGGYIALEMAANTTAKPAALGLFHSTAFADSPEKRVNRDKTAEFIEKHGAPTFIQSFVAPLFAAKNRETCQAVIETLIRRGSQNSKESLIGYTLAMKNRANHMATLTQYKGDKLMICGEEDPAVPLEASLKHQQAVTAFHRLPDCGHMGMFEKQADCQAIIRQFMKSSSPKDQ